MATVPGGLQVERLCGKVCVGYNKHFCKDGQGRLGSYKYCLYLHICKEYNDSGLPALMSKPRRNMSTNTIPISPINVAERSDRSRMLCVQFIDINRYVRLFVMTRQTLATKVKTRCNNLSR